MFCIGWQPDYNIRMLVRCCELFFRGFQLRKTSKLYVIDVNDNQPSFTNLPYRVDVPEVGLVVFSVLSFSETFY